MFSINFQRPMYQARERQEGRKTRIPFHIAENQFEKESHRPIDDFFDPEIDATRTSDSVTGGSALTSARGARTRRG